MPESMQAGYEHLENLLFVTTDRALSTFQQSEADIRAFLGDDRFYLIPPEQSLNVGRATAAVRNKLAAVPTATGVVILGNYADVPSRRIFAYDVDPGLGGGLEDGGWDNDKWVVWSDDMYGDRDGDAYHLADLPVSRIPIVPTVGGLFGPARTGNPDRSLARGYRSDDCRFSQTLFDDLLQGAGGTNMRVSPPDGANITGPSPEEVAKHDLDGTSLPANLLYLAMHGDEENGLRFWGRKPGEEVVAFDHGLAGGDWPADSVVFAAACWGGLSTMSARKHGDTEDPPSLRTTCDSIALALLDRGINAFVGFTGYHYVPVRGAPPAKYTGLPLNYLFWQNLISGSSPAQALFDARVTYVSEAATLIDGAEPPTLDAQALRIVSKTFWSATCLGLGW